MYQGRKLFIPNYCRMLLSMNENKIRPDYYKGDGKIEVWDFIASQKLNFFEGNIIKYVCRHKGKNGLEDLKKAKEYLNKLIETYEQ